VNGWTVLLASASPRRRELLESLGLHPRVFVPDVDETPQLGETPEGMVLRLARAKALSVARAEPGYAGLVIAADTTVVVAGESLGKPRDDAEAVDFLRRLAGRDHWVHTGHALRRGDREVSVIRSTRVRFRPLSEGEIARYVATGEGRDKAGAYAIQGIGAMLVEGIEGCYGAVVGLSLPTVISAARELGVDLV
jgi:septum formation protein